MYNESCISMKSQCESCCVVLNIIKSHAVTYLVMYLYYAYWRGGTTLMFALTFSPHWPFRTSITFHHLHFLSLS